MCAQKATYLVKKQAKEEVALVGLNRSLKQSLQDVDVHYPAERTKDEADNRTPVAVDQCTANCLEETVWSFTTMWSRCQLSCTDVKFHHLLSLFQLVSYS